MVDVTANNKRIVKNTMYLYFRTFFTLGVSLFTSRIVLQALGVDNFGIYNIVGGFVAMFSVLSGTLTAATQRFITFELARKNPQSNKIFSVSLLIHFILAIILFILLETVGLWFLNYKINIPTERLLAANWVFQCSILTFCVNLISIPYNASIIAHEKMNVFAFISIFEVSTKLIIAYILIIFNTDKLVMYAVLMLIVALLLRFIYGFYCKSKFEECVFVFDKDKVLYKQMLSFSGWNFIGSSAGILNTQGVNILINLFFGVTLNAARGIAEQVNAAVNNFIMNFMTAINPQITKSYASGNFHYLNVLVVKGTKYSFFLFGIICLPILMETNYILELWLVKVPDYAPVLVRMAIIYSACQILSQTLYTAMLATGRIKKYQIAVGTLSIMAFPVTYLFYKLGLSVEYGYLSSIIFSLICLCVRLYMLRKMIPQFSIKLYIRDCLQRLFYVICILLSTSFLIKFSTKGLDNNMLKFIVNTFCFIILSFLTMLTVGLNREEKITILTYIKSRLEKYRCQ